MRGMRFNRWVTVCLGWRTEANLARVGAGFPHSKFWGEKVFLVHKSLQMGSAQ